MKNLPTFAAEPELWDDMDPYFTDLIKEAEFANMTERQQERYIAKMMHEWDYENSIDYAEEKGIEKGVEKVARRMLKKGLDVADIIEYTGLTEEQVRAL